LLDAGFQEMADDSFAKLDRGQFSLSVFPGAD